MGSMKNHDPLTGADKAVRPRVSVIIPHLNTQESLARCLDSVVGQRLDAGTMEVIVVDNGSTTAIDSVKAAFPQVCFLEEAAPGPGLARNRGIAAAAAAVIAFIDADCRAGPGWLQAAVETVEANPQRAIVGGDIRIDFADPIRLTGIEAYEAEFGFRQRHYIPKKHFSVTANLAMARGVHAIVGDFAGIDTAEDLDWGQRAHNAGFTTIYHPAMRVYHPARPQFAALERKWQRHIRHDWNAHMAHGGPTWKWRARAFALLASIPIESLRLFGSNRISGVGNRVRGTGILARIRLFRAAEMLRVVSSPNEDGASFWNRQ
jgi:glycosyltransferase involved in cell wall biosynthesis